MIGILSRRSLITLGTIMFLAGVTLVAVGLLSYFGQDGDSARGETASSVSRPVTETPAPIHRTPTPTSTVTPTLTDTPSPTPPLGDAPFRMVIESIGVDAPVETYGLDENAVPEVPTGDDAAEVVAWYDFSARPGMGSNAVFSGHVTWFGEAVFWNLKKLQPGDTIKLVGEDGTELVYAVSDSFLVDPEDPESLKVMWATATDVITLITCDGDFIDTGDPVFGGEYTDRRVVRADLVSINAVGALPEPSSSSGLGQPGPTGARR